jgi:uncharacterized delta-60 repeat protein
MVSLLLAFLGALTAPRASAAPGDLDPKFSRDGKRGIDFGKSFRHGETVLDIEELADGRIVVVGASFTNPSVEPNMNIVIARLEQDGSLDTTHSGDGRQVVDPPGVQSWSDASIQPDGSVAVVGGQPPAPHDFLVARIRSDGVLDPSFSGDGMQQVGFGSGSDDGAAAVLTQPDGKLVVGGFAGGNSEADFAFARILQNGELDSDFSADGRATVAFSDESFLNDLALSESGEIVAVGLGGASPGFPGDYLAVARLTPDGSPDPTLGGDGAENVNLVDPPGVEWEQSVALQSDGRIVIGGVVEFFTIRPTRSPVLVRLEQDGDVDPSFGVLSELPVPYVTDVAVQLTGILGVGPSVEFSSLADFVLFRRQVDGEPDLSFPRPDGSVATDFDARTDDASALSVQGDGRVLVAGLVELRHARIAIARYLMDEGRRDQDADGIRDKPDRCPRGFSKRRRGCPRLKDDGSVSLTVFDDGSGRWGIVISNYVECMDGRRVLILKPRPGKDRLVKSTKAVYYQEDEQGEFPFSPRPGRYHARVPRSVEEVGICRALRSSPVRVHK